MLKRLFILGTLLGWASVAPASYALDRAAQALDRGAGPKARFLYGQLLDNNPCDAAALAGLIRAHGDPAPYRRRCPGQAVRPARALSSAPPAPRETPVAVVRPVPQRQPAAPKATVKSEGAQGPVGHAQPPYRDGAGPSRPWRAWRDLLGIGVLAAGLALLTVAVVRRRRGPAPSAAVSPRPSVAVQGTDASGPPSAPSAVAPPAPTIAMQGADAASPVPLPVAVAPALVGPPALTPTQAAALPAAWTSPLTPGEAVIARLDGARSQVGLTARQLYFRGPRGLKEGWFRRQEALTLAVPLPQVTGLAWAERGGERLIVGTALAGDIALQASDFGALALRQFAQQLASALERPLA